MLKYALGGIVLSTSMHATAFSLGGYSGQAILGRPLDIQVRSNTPLADIELAGCLLAEVSYGDTRLPASSVSLGVSAAGEGAVIRVRTSVPVNEPVVSVTLQAGCAADRFSRKYNLLADIDPSVSAAAPAGLPLVVTPPAGATLAAAPAPAPVTAAPLPAAGMPSVPAAAASAPAASPSAPRAEPATASPRPAPRPPARAQAPRPAPAPQAREPAKRQAPATAAAPAVQPAASPAPQPAPKAAAAAAAPSGPRLKLDPIDLSPGRNPGLKLNTELSSSPAASAPQREASADLWAALNTPPEQVAENARRVAAMENDLKALREQQAALQASVAALTAQLQAERDERAPKSLLYALGGALALAAAALAWLLVERRKLSRRTAAGDAPWWQPSDLAPGSQAGAAPMAPTVAPAVVSAPSAMPTPSTVDPMAALEVSEATESSFVQPLETSPVSVEDLMDLHQQREFFVSLHQENEAQALLEHFIAQHPGACEWPYLCLLQQAGDNNELRERAARLYQTDFGLPAPTGSLVDPAASGLVSETKFVEVLTRFWPRAESLDLVRNTLLAPPHTGLLERHSLAAYEDLLMLYGVAHTLQHDTDLRPPASRPAPVATSTPRPVESADWSVPVPVVATAAEVSSASASPPAQPAAVSNTPLDLDLGLLDSGRPAEPATPPADDASAKGRELPMLDFDLFAIDADKPAPPPGHARG